MFPATDMPGDVEVVGGSSLGKNLAPVPYITLGKAARVTTGTPIPNGADAVVPVEQTVVLAESNDVSERAGVWTNAFSITSFNPITGLFCHKLFYQSKVG